MTHLDQDRCEADFEAETARLGAAVCGLEPTTDVTVRAPARELLLVLNRRLDPDRQGVEIVGDRALFTHWLEHSRW